METIVPTLVYDTAVNLQPEIIGYSQHLQIPAYHESKFKLLRKVLEKARVTLTSVQGHCDHLIGLLRANLGQRPNEPSRCLQASLS